MKNSIVALSGLTLLPLWTCAEISDPVSVVVDSAAVLQWRTLTADVTPVRFDWPDRAQSADWTIRRMGRTLVDSGTIERGTGQKSSSFALSVRSPSTAEEEATYVLSVVFKDAQGVELVGDALSATVARVGGVGGWGARYLDAASRSWRKVGNSAVLPIAADADPVMIDGKVVETGLDGAVGWYGWSPIGSGSHALSFAGVDSVEVTRVGGFILYLR